VLEKVVEEAEEAKAAAYDPLAHKSLEELKELEVCCSTDGDAPPDG